MRKIHIAIVNRGAGMFRGGGEQFDLQIAREFVARGHEVTFVTGRPWRYAPRYGSKTFTVKSVVYLRTPYLRESIGRLPIRGAARFVEWLDQRPFERAAFAFFSEHKPDIAQLCSLTWLGAALTARLGIPSVIHFPGPPHLRHRKDILRCSAVISEGDALSYIRKSLRNDALEIPPGVATDVFRPMDGNRIRLLYDIPDFSFVLLFVGRLIPIKNLTFLIETFAHLLEKGPQSILMIIGDGPEKARVREFAAKLGINQNVRFISHVMNSELPDYYAAADVFCLSSSYDNFPNVVIEAMACGKPIVATRVGGVPSQVIHGINGFLVDPGDRAGFITATLRLLDDAELRRQMGQANRELIGRDYSWTRTANRLLECYKEVIQQTSNPKPILPQN